MLCVALGSLRGGNFAVESMATLPWNERQLCYGISGKFGVESVATLLWNRWQLSRGIRNMARYYCLTVERNLFGEFALVGTWGRMTSWTPENRDL